MHHPSVPSAGRTGRLDFVAAGERCGLSRTTNLPLTVVELDELEIDEIKASVDLFDTGMQARDVGVIQHEIASGESARSSTLPQPKLSDRTRDLHDR